MWCVACVATALGRKMIRLLPRWIIHCRATRQRWRIDARLLANLDSLGSCYEAQRRVFPSRADGDLDEF
ncbi:hypothetical protein BTN45_25995 (plasmid) [Rhizobium sp. ZX09]|nr:hypothetical protein BTN45_25995 [Rhizobium sp. ZX09]